MTLDERYLFATEFLAEPAVQVRLIEAVRESGELSSGSFDNAGAPYWRWKSLTLPVPESLPSGVRAFLDRRPAADFDRWSYFSRLDPSLEWRWTEGRASDLVRAILAPVERLFRKLTRVKVDLQIPGQALPAHRDLVPGSHYDTLQSEYSHAWGERRLMYRAQPWLWEAGPLRNIEHRDNRYLSMKIPLSEKADDPGQPYVVIGAQRHYYTSRNRLFFLNEAEMFHGADPADHWRGVVFVNGLWDLDALDGYTKRPIEVLRTL